MNKDTRDGCAIGCGLIIGVIFLNWLAVIGIIWLICILLSPFGVVFDLGLATAAWLALGLLWLFFGGKK